MNAGSGSAPLKCAIWTHRKKDATVSPRVLVVDDFVDTADAISMVLGLSGFDTDAVYGGGPAIDVTTRWRPQIILLDIWMPDMSGLEVAARLRENRRTSETILIAHSAAAGERDLEQAQQVGFDAFCAKPTDAAALGPLLRYFVPEPGTTRQQAPSGSCGK